ncbi:MULTISPECIES: SdiA-regulated domain-containing protein [unclassified Pseudomonas]|uniref:SdiA-regulated domain-containing protein n=1 Tax=unclassified Pseudomonas TaxID=196821 RepID=UPI000887853D|nr:MULTISPECIES: SdiA-regulated domain-containing protein [unclassified Pseudomonas]UVL58133.1 SdiA-regulated domain-containing protein [Pseudomonas sp. B21-035]SDQ83709.1 Uncharacterized protein YjiK [Pseudomonas sp. UC 17F4]
MSRFTAVLAFHWLTFRRYPLIWVASLIALVMTVLALFEADDALGQLWQERITPVQVRQRSIWLPDYRFAQRLQLPGIEANASDIVYVAERRSYFVVVNSPAQLYEYTEDFALKARHELHEFEDPEALAYDGKGHLLIGEERRQSVVTVPIAQLDRPIVRSELATLSIADRADNNRGLEGMAFDPSSQVLFASREQRPVRLFEVAGVVQPEASVSYQAAVSALGVQRLRMDDISAMHYDLHTRHLLVLSDQSRLLAEVDSGYAPISFMDLEGGFNGLDHSVPQAEGVTLGPQRQLLIVSEPNLLYRYQLAD